MAKEAARLGRGGHHQSSLLQLQLERHDVFHLL